MMFWVGSVMVFPVVASIEVSASGRLCVLWLLGVGFRHSCCAMRMSRMIVVTSTKAGCNFWPGANRAGSITIVFPLSRCCSACVNDRASRRRVVWSLFPFGRLVNCVLVLIVGSL